VEGFCEIALVEVALFENSVPNPRLKFPIFFPFQWLHLEVYPSTVMAPWKTGHDYHMADPQAHAAPVSRIRVTWDEWLGRGQVGCHLQNPQAMMVWMQTASLAWTDILGPSQHEPTKNSPRHFAPKMLVQWYWNQFHILNGIDKGVHNCWEIPEETVP
jgi:hypothetical protein